jgi:hypothetical protein
MRNFCKNVISLPVELSAWQLKDRTYPSHRGGTASGPGQVMWDLWWTRWHWGKFSPSISVSLANSHSTDCSTLIIIYHPGLVQ